MNKCRNWNICTHLKFENHLTSCAVLFLLNLMSGKYIFKIAEEGYRVQKNINFAFLKCIGVNVELCKSDMEYPENETKTHNWKKCFCSKKSFLYFISNCVFVWLTQSSRKVLMFLGRLILKISSLLFCKSSFNWHLFRLEHQADRFQVGFRTLRSVLILT